jgi:prevent-host-death family protein
MRFITVRDLRLKPGEIWKLTKQEKEIVITSKGRPVALLTGVDAESLEEELEILRRARALKALDDIQKASMSKGTYKIKDSEIEAEIEAARKAR